MSSSIALLKNSEVLNELATVLERDGIIIQDYVREMLVLRQVGAVEGAKHRVSARLGLGNKKHDANICHSEHATRMRVLKLFRPVRTYAHNAWRMKSFIL